MSNALSIVPSEGANSEFPVLKAFQEYIDAEQAKARKRMLGLSVFFIILLVVVVVTFVLVLTTVVNRNQALSDRLLDYALKEKEKTPQVVAQPVTERPSVQDMLKPLFDRFEREQMAMKAMYEKQQKEAEARYEKQQKETEARYEKQRKETDARIKEREKNKDEEFRKMKEALDKERMLIQKESDRQAEIERHRRRLYPEYYKLPENLPTPAPSQSPSKPKTIVSSKSPTPNTAVESRSYHETKKESSLSKIKPITYFNTDDEDGVPFLIETPPKTSQK